MFHDLTDRPGRAAITLAVPHGDWPNHRFCFGTPGAGMSALLDGPVARSDILDVSGAVPDGRAVPSGLYVQERRDGFIGVLAGHENHEGLRSPA